MCIEQGVRLIIQIIPKYIENLDWAIVKMPSLLSTVQLYTLNKVVSDFHLIRDNSDHTIKHFGYVTIWNINNYAIYLKITTFEN